MTMYWDYLVAARVACSEGNDTKCWQYLFEAELSKDEMKPWTGRRNTDRQEEVHRLWQIRGTLERTLANLRIVSEMIQPVESQITLTNAITAVHALIAKNKEAFNTISQRI